MFRGAGGVVLTVIDVLNRIIGAVVGVVLAPFQSHPAWGMTVVSAIAGAVLLLVYKATSSQEGIRNTKARIWARFYELRLFQHDIRLLLSAQASLLRANFRYLSHSLIPLLFMVPPVVLLLAQLNLRYGLRPLRPGEITLMKVTARDAAILEGATIEGDGGCVVVASQAVRIPVLKEVVWRLKAVRDGRCSVRVHAGGETMSKEIVVGHGAVPVSPKRIGTRWWELVLTPGERPLRADTVAELEVHYPERDFKLAGVHVPWWLAFFVLSLAFGLVLKSPLGVQI
jgi:uncharacterized membrane protein YeaQ/YmgE (transglycosylase-associated protein family)